MSNLRYYTNLDGIRGIAALMVIVFHFFGSESQEYLEKIDLFRQLTEFGQHGVTLFFVLSGFVITRILINTRNKTGYFSLFYLKRILRILPLYYLYLIAHYYLLPVILDKPFTNFNYQIPVYFYLQNLTEVLNIKASGPGHFWSLAVEEHFYLLWPLVVFVINPKHLSKLIAVIIIGVFFLKYYMLKNGYSINYFTFTRVDQLLMGAILALLESNGFFKDRHALKKMLFIGLTVFPIAVIVYIFSGKFYFIKEMMKYPILGLFFFAAIGLLISTKDKNIINLFLTSKVLQYLGKISYGLYVWHIFALRIVEKFLLTKMWIIDMFLEISLSIFLAHLSFFLFEKYFLELKNRIRLKS